MFIERDIFQSFKSERYEHDMKYHKNVETFLLSDISSCFQDRIKILEIFKKFTKNVHI